MYSAALLAILREIETLLDAENNSQRIGDLVAGALELGFQVQQQFAALVQEYTSLSVRHGAWQRTGLSLSSRDRLTTDEEVSMDRSRPIPLVRPSRRDQSSYIKTSSGQENWPHLVTEVQVCMELQLLLCASLKRKICIMACAKLWATVSKKI